MARCFLVIQRIQRCIRLIDSKHESRGSSQNDITPRNHHEYSVAADPWNPWLHCAMRRIVNWNIWVKSLWTYEQGQRRDRACCGHRGEFFDVAILALRLGASVASFDQARLRRMNRVTTLSNRPLC